MDFAFERFFFGKGGHHKEAIAENHAVSPALVVLVELDEFFEVQPVELSEEVELRGRLAQGFNDGFWRNFFLDVDGEGFRFEPDLVLFGFACPDELRRERRVVSVADFLWAFFVVCGEGAKFGGWNVWARGIVRVGFDGGIVGIWRVARRLGFLAWHRWAFWFAPRSYTFA
ncbi:MAG: hypothetical protein RMM16_11590 [Chloroherpetonaceae bacterium]|nr:hypothetical protein [Chloroherpetonaceae bacterium]